MQIEEAGRILGEMYNSAPEGSKVVQVHLFGIKYGPQVTNISCTDLAAAAGLPSSYATEIRKGINLASFVSIKD